MPKEDQHEEEIYVGQVTDVAIVDEHRRSRRPFEPVIPEGLGSAVFVFAKGFLQADDLTKAQAEFFATIPGYRVEGFEEAVRASPNVTDWFVFGDLEAEKARRKQLGLTSGALLPSDTEQLTQLMAMIAQKLADTGAAPPQPAFRAEALPPISREAIKSGNPDAEAFGELEMLAANQGVVLLSKDGKELVGGPRQIKLFAELAKKARESAEVNLAIYEILENSAVRSEMGVTESESGSESKSEGEASKE
jgi:hypothetical protein